MPAVTSIHQHQLAGWPHGLQIGKQTNLQDTVCDLQEAQALFMSDMTKTAMADKFIALQNAAGITTPLVNPRGSGVNAVTLTGWGALAALTSFTTVSLGLVYLVYRRFVAPAPTYAPVSKSGDV